MIEFVVLEISNSMSLELEAMLAAVDLQLGIFGRNCPSLAIHVFDVVDKVTIVIGIDEQLVILIFDFTRMTCQVLINVNRRELIVGLRCFFSNEEDFLLCHTARPYEWGEDRCTVRLDCDVEAATDELEVGVQVVTRLQVEGLSSNISEIVCVDGQSEFLVRDV